MNDSGDRIKERRVVKVGFQSLLFWQHPQLLVVRAGVFYGVRMLQMMGSSQTPSQHTLQMSEL